MSVRITSAQLDPQSVATGAGCRLVVGAEAYGVVMEYLGYILVDINDAELRTADDLDCTLNYTNMEIDEAISWLLRIGGN